MAQNVIYSPWEGTRGSWLCLMSKVKMLVSPSCLILCDTKDYNPPGSSVHGISQARILDWVAIPFYRGSSRPRDWTWVSCLAGGFFTIWAATRQAQPGLGSHFSHHSLNISGFSTSYYQQVTSLQIINIFINLYRMFLPLCVLFVATDLLSFFFFF